eukprot:1051884-Rhodomonas_salina.3
MSATDIAYAATGLRGAQDGMSAITLRACYAMSGTELACTALRTPYALDVLPSTALALAVQCPVLS